MNMRPNANGANALHGASAEAMWPSVKSKVGYFVGGFIIAPIHGFEIGRREWRRERVDARDRRSTSPTTPRDARRRHFAKTS